MMEKVKLTQQQADAIEVAKKENVNDFLKIHARCNGGWTGELKPLNNLEFLELAKALLIGYEVEKRFEVGDWVIKEGSNRIAKITKIVDGHMVYGHWNSGDVPKWNAIQSIRHATPEEIKAEQERRVWKSVGREVKEFKPGDFVEIERELGFRIHTERQIRISEDKYDEGKVVGFYPAESFISFGGESHDK